MGGWSEGLGEGGGGISEVVLGREGEWEEYQE